ncbi:hypothetical protein HGM15179_019210 [Zosterops borbonicus]|uniref:Uncharacterized protein n=1 Tax=Zosterops borbonicus TaxID=364589 RepID=A0A8K1FW43_9PASS|nr:hypothetical protein HGM15179_019210 [Zosterops borbonicus]
MWILSTLDLVKPLTVSHSIILEKLASYGVDGYTLLVKKLDGWLGPQSGSLRHHYKSGFCEKLPEASPMPNRANASWLQERPATGQGQANQE